jgi:hypothetical protein
MINIILSMKICDFGGAKLIGICISITSGSNGIRSGNGIGRGVNIRIGIRMRSNVGESREGIK